MYKLSAGIVIGSFIFALATAYTYPNGYIVTFYPSNYAHFSSHALFRRGVEEHNINLKITREYNSPMFSGVAVLLSNPSDLARLEQLAVLKAIHPINVHPGPKITPDSLLKRADPNRAYWTHRMTGVDRLHNEGHFGLDVKIAIIDSGIDYWHPTLGAGIGPNNKVIGGYDFVGDDFTGEIDSPPAQESPYPLDTCNGHGTFMAGVIGANPNNPRGIVGVAPEARINSYRVLGCQGSTSDDILMAALLRADVDDNHIISISVGLRFGWGEHPLAVVARGVADHGRVVVFTAGNEGQFGSWYSGDIGNGPGIIHVGHAQGATSNAYRPEDAMMAPTSSYGPSYSMQMRPTLSAPGMNVLSTWPRDMGRFKSGGGSSVAVPYVAGAVALWLQVQGLDRANPWNAVSALQNTAYSMRQNGQTRGLFETVSHQGAGLIQVYDAAHLTKSVSPAELLLSDTRQPQLSRKLIIRNWGERPVPYQLTHVPAGTVRTIEGIENVVGVLPLVNSPAAVAITPSEFTIAAGSSRSVTVTFRPPIQLNPAAFPVYSGYIRATAQDGSGSVLQSTYLGVAASLYNMKILDTTNGVYPDGVPLLRDLNGNGIRGPSSYSMLGPNVPELVFRLVGGTPLLRLDLVAARTRLPVERRGLSGSFTKRGLCNSLSSTFSSRRFSCIPSRSWSSRVRMRGLIVEVPYMPRNLRAEQSNSRFPLIILRITHFADGTEIPNGDYRLLLRVLKISGRASRWRDWEYWLSPQIGISRAGG